MIWGFTEFRTNKNWKYDFFNEHFTRADVIDLKIVFGYFPMFAPNYIMLILLI